MPKDQTSTAELERDEVEAKPAERAAMEEPPSTTGAQQVASLPEANRLLRVAEVVAAAKPDLHDSDDPTTVRDQVDLARAVANVGREDPVAPEQQKTGGEALGLPPDRGSTRRSFVVWAHMKPVERRTCRLRSYSTSETDYAFGVCALALSPVGRFSLMRADFPLRRVR